MDHSEEDLSDDNLQWLDKPIIKYIFRLIALISFISTCLNTPKTLEEILSLQYTILILDIICAIVLTIEAVVKIKNRNILSGKKSYLRNQWNQFDLVMIICIYSSILLQIFELTNVVHFYNRFRIVRSLRSFILLKLFRTFLKFDLPENKIKSILQRSSSQIYNVTVFFLFFMSLYAIVGVQFFGTLVFHCVRNGTDLKNLVISDLMIPDTYCSQTTDGFQCPPNFLCEKIEIERDHRGYNGFDELATSFLTIYEAASQEGWVFLMYRAIDSLPSWRAYIYFSTMIFFLAWLVKNVFIAVIIETFAEIRVQFQEMWGSQPNPSDIITTKVLKKTDEFHLKLIDIDENEYKGFAPNIFRKFLRSTIFRTMIILVIFANTIVTSTIKHTHNEMIDRENRKFYYKIEVLFTLFFNLEVLFKIFSLGLKNYFRRSIYKFELILAIGTTIHCFPPFYRSTFTYFQGLRVARLLKSSPLLENFLYKIFGPGKKVGSLILFTLCLLLITSSISMQLFCFIKDLEQFATFPKAFMSMFRIAMNDGWTEVMYSAMNEVYDLNIYFTCLTALFFIFFHLLTNSIVLSLFVAAILDNLEIQEDAKMIKQLKMREASAEIEEKLAWRLRVFQRFPDHPQMIKLKRFPHEFNVPKVRDSFMRQFLADENVCRSQFDFSNHLMKKKWIRPPSHSSSQRLHTESIKRKALTNIIKNSNNQRLFSGDLSQMHLASLNDYKSSLYLEENKTRLDQREVLVHRSEPMYSMKEMIGLSNFKNQVQDNYDMKLFQYRKQQAQLKRNQEEEDLRENHRYFDTPLFIVGRDSKFRKFCQFIVEAHYNMNRKDRLEEESLKIRYRQGENSLGLIPYLDYLMIIITIISTVSMSFETPSNRVVEKASLQVGDYLFVISMSIELTLKIFAHGFVFTPKALIGNVSGILDLFIYLVSLIFLCWLPRHIEANSLAQCLMLLRCTRPLRIFILLPDMKKIVYEVCRGFKEILLVSMLFVVLMFMFAIYGIQVIGGQLARCNDRDLGRYEYRENCTGTFWRELDVSKMDVQGERPKLLVPRVWANPHNFNFDYIGSAMLALFEVLSLEGWLDIRDIIMDRMESHHVIFVHIFVFMGTLIGLTLFIGVVIANYSENKGTALLTVDQRRWMDLKGRIKLVQPLRTPPRPNNNKFRAYIYDITQRKIFKKASVVLVLLNSALLYKPWLINEEMTKISALISSLFTFLFLIEALMKCFALGIMGYWQSRSNRFDLFVTILGIIWIILNFISLGKTNFQEFSNTFGFTVIILRFFTIANKHATLKMLMLTIIVSFFKSFFVILGMFLLMLVYAFIGVILFGTVKFGSELSRHANFKTVPNAIVLLMRIVTGEDWNKIMHDCMITPPRCTRVGSYWESDCGNSIASILYFCSFYVIITYIVLNLLVAIIMENFSLFYSNEEDALLSYMDIRHFQTVWNIIDIDRKGLIPVRRVKFLIKLLQGRLFVKETKLYKHMCYEIEKLNNGHDVTFHDVLNMLAYRTVDISKSLQFEELLAREELQYMIEEEVAKLTIRNWLNKCLRRIKGKDQANLIKSLQKSNELAFFREAQAAATATMEEANKKTKEAELEERSTADESKEQTSQKNLSKRRLSRITSYPTATSESTSQKTNNVLDQTRRDSLVLSRGPNQQAQLRNSNSPTYAWRSWKTNNLGGDERRDIQSWWTDQLQ